MRRFGADRIRISNTDGSSRAGYLRHRATGAIEKRWRTSRWREFKKVARAQHWALPNGQQLHLDILSLIKHFFIFRTVSPEFEFLSLKMYTN